jgi:predicted GTPase
MLGRSKKPLNWPGCQLDSKEWQDRGVAGRVTRDPLAVQVVRLANRIHATLSDQGRADLAKEITDESALWNRQQLVVVACGDVKRGKSSLLNALLGRPGLLPVDADVATSANLIVTYGDTSSVLVTRLDDKGKAEQFTVELDQLVDVASMSGDPSQRAGVSLVEVTLPHPLLERGITLMDTPGVGGMSQGHRDIALVGLAQADVLLFTASAEEPIARTELEFLAEASARCDRMIIAVTKTDTNTEEQNAAMVAEHRDKLSVYANQLTADDADRLVRLAAAPLVLTSSHLAAQAARRLEAGRVEQAMALRERSGIDVLVSVLERSADNRDLIRVANLVSLLELLLTDGHRTLRLLQRTLDGDASAAEELAAKQRSLEEFASRQARWRTTLSNAISRLQLQSSRLVTHELGAVRDHYRSVIEQSDDAEALALSLPADLERSLHAAWNELVLKLNAEFTEKLGAVLDDLGADGMDAVLGSFEMPEGLRQFSGSRLGQRNDPNMLEDGLPVAMQTFTFANIANAAAGALGIATGGLGLLAYGIGASVAYPVAKLRRKAKTEHLVNAELQRHVADALFGQEGIAREFTTELSLRILDLREEVEQFVEQRLTERRKQLEQEHKELLALQKSEAGKRKELSSQAEGRIQALGKFRAELQPLRIGIERKLLEKSGNL